MNLNWLIIVPLLTVLALLPFRELRWARSIALAGSVVQLALVIWLTALFVQQPEAQVPGTFLFETQYAWYEPLGIYHHTGIDGISLSMLLLTALVVVAGVLVSWQVPKMPREFFMLLTLLSLGAYGFFISLDAFTMFFFLELAVVPKFLLIGIWGSGSKTYSATKLVLMLMGASALLFVGIAGLYFYQAKVGGGFGIIPMMQQGMDATLQLFFFPFVFVGFGVFTALFPFHTWVPDGHSSAPTAASMFLAGISMKLGGYGIIRLGVLAMPYAAQYYAPLIVVLAAIAILYGSLATMMQTDLKYMNAYSSVSHTGFVLLGIGLLTQAALTGAVLQMVSHGLMTALFFAVIGMVYQRTHTRQVGQMGGLLKVMPFISTVFVLVGLTSLGLPGLSGFVAEMLVFMGGWQNGGTLQKIATVAAAASIVVTAVYILRAIGKVLMGPVAEKAAFSITPAAWYEKLAACLLLAGILAMGLWPRLMQKMVTPGVQQLLQHTQIVQAP